MDKEGAKRVEIGGINDKRQICSQQQSAENFSQYNLCIKEKTNQCHSRVCFPEDWHITHSPNHWSNETMIDYITKIIIPFTKKKRRELHLPNDQATLAIFDEFKIQLTEKCTDVLLGRQHPHCQGTTELYR